MAPGLSFFFLCRRSFCLESYNFFNLAKIIMFFPQNEKKIILRVSQSKLTSDEQSFKEKK